MASAVLPTAILDAALSIYRTLAAALALTAAPGA
jgi:hypothetical protein